MAFELHFRGQARQAPTGDLSDGREALRRVAIASSVLQMLYAATLAVEDDGVEIDPPVDRGLKDQARRALVESHRVSVRPQRLQCRVHRIQPDDKVEVVMLSCLLAEKRVNTPTTIEPAGYSGISESVHDAYDFRRGHHRCAFYRVERN